MALSIDLKDIKPILGGLFGGKGDDAPPQPTQPQVPAGPPPPPQATPAVAGFSEWSADPQNQQKVAHAITQPGQPIIPQNVRQQATEMASLNPPPMPQAPQMASIGGPPVMPSPTPAMVQPKQNPLQTKLGADQTELARLQSTGSGVSQIKSPWLRTAARIADVAGTVVAPGVAPLVPGTEARNWMLQRQKQGQIAQDQDALAKEAQLADTQSQTQERLGKAAKANAQADAVGDPATQHAKQITDLAKQGLKPVYDSNGVLTGVAPDENSPKYQADQAHIEDMKAQKALRDAQTEVEKAKNDPNSPAYKFALQKLAVAQQNAAAAQKRATAYMGRYMQSAYNVGLDGQVLPGTPIINDANGNETAVGTANANNAIKQQGATVTFNDLQGSAAHARAALDALHKSGGDLSDPLVIAAMQDPTSLTGKMVNGQLVKPNLSQQQIEAIGALNQLREQIGILRAATKGTAAEAQTERMLATLPTAGDTKATAINKMDELNGVMGRVRPGVTRVSGGQKVNGLTPPPSSGGGMITMKLSNGQTGQIHSSQKARFLRDNPGAVEVTNAK